MKARDKAEAASGREASGGEYKGKGERLTTADSPVDRAVKTMLGRKSAAIRKSAASPMKSATASMSRRMGVCPMTSPTGGPEMGFGQKPETRGSLNARDFAIPTRELLDFVHTDPEHTIPAYLRTVIPDMHLTSRFGDVDMTDPFKQVKEWYDAQFAATTDARKNCPPDQAARRGSARSRRDPRPYPWRLWPAEHRRRAQHGPGGARGRQLERRRVPWLFGYQPLSGHGERHRPPRHYGLHAGRVRSLFQRADEDRCRLGGRAPVDEAILASASTRRWAISRRSSGTWPKTICLATGSSAGCNRSLRQQW